MGTKTQRIAGIALAVALAAPVAPATEGEAGDHAATQAVLDRYQRKAGPGAAVHAGDGRGSWTLSSGSATSPGQRPITADDHFRIASQTKTFTAVVVLQLFDEGAVDLDAPIERYLPGVVTGNFDGTVITVRRLLNHTAGFPHDAAGAKTKPDGTYDLAALVRAAMDDKPVSAPGTYHYSNVGYQVLGLLIEKLTGKYVGDAITERIIEPFGLAETSFPPPGKRTLADPYLPGYQGFQLGGAYFWVDMTTSFELSRWSSAAAMESTLADLAKFSRALGSGQVVSPKALAEMRTVVPWTPNAPAGYGLGQFSIQLSCGGVAWGHDGLLPTGHASLTLATDDGRFASVMTNSNRLPTDPSAIDVANSALCEGN
ncbi:serine hydrolase [Amycolatopsis sp. WAC 01376]|uniref:serine hydrolase domain-containing protein n=1 Tax=Amycolatopsis sp. WAC 01376 TaxID=2203195 RepID=UPI000F78FC5F|nr:serine hydrolase domain-containing protein [Amycolatopsis sp. WAC 01376]RSM55190.1 serine hydrolase [Amycolatopsis sp. WAC 01376]